MFVYDDEGNEYLESVAGLWSASLGFGGEPRLVEAARKAMERLPFYHQFGPKAHEFRIELGEARRKGARSDVEGVLLLPGLEANDRSSSSSGTTTTSAAARRRRRSSRGIVPITEHACREPDGLVPQPSACSTCPFRTSSRIARTITGGAARRIRGRVRRSHHRRPRGTHPEGGPDTSQPSSRNHQRRRRRRRPGPVFRAFKPSFANTTSSSASTK